jgi:probable DNA metabolism protein
MIYFFDGSEDGFLTAFLQAFHDENALLSSQKTQLIVGEQSLFVSTDSARAKRARERLLSFDKNAAHDLTLLLRCGQVDNEQVAFNYLRTLAQRKAPVKTMLTNRIVFIAVEYMKKVAFEIHRFHGFIRFMESASGALYAPFSPDNDICDLLLPHFKARLPQYPFVLHDVSRKKAAVYDGEHSFVAPLSQADVLLSAKETQWQALWKGYYNAVNIPSRERLKQMRGYMPARYWKFLPEKNENQPPNR